MDVGTIPDPAARRLFVRLLLTMAFAILLVRLLGFAVMFVRESVQMDLAAFHTAGRSAARGLSPYETHVALDPQLWDGLARFTHSRFVYPPLTAQLFRPLARLSYPAAKILWTAGSLVALVAALVVSARLAGLRLGVENALVLASVAAGAYPVLTLLERGQVDAWTLLLVISGVWLIERGRPGSGGVALATAALFKPTLAWIAVFLLVDRRWRAAAGFALGAVGLLTLGLMLDGPAEYEQFLLRHLPRIGTYGEGGTREMLLPRESFAAAPLPQAGEVIKDGLTYRTTSFRFVLNATPVQSRLVRELSAAAAGMGVPFGPPVWSAIFIGCGAAVVVAWRRAYGPPPSPLLYSQLALALILLAGPVSWAMTVVWLLPSAAIVMAEASRSSGRGHAVAVALGAGALALAVAPDPWANAMLLPFGERALDQKYIVAELFLAAALLLLWRNRAIRYQPPN